MQHKIHTDEELRELVIAVYDCKAFTSLQCRDYEIQMCFPVLMFLLSPPDPPSLPDQSGNIKIDRMNKLNHINDMVYYNEVTLPDWEKKRETSDRSIYR